MARTIRWGVVGLGGIAHRVLKGFKATPPDATEVVAVGSRDLAKAKAFADTYGIPKALGSYDAVISDPDVDLVYVALPNHLHAPVTLKALAARKAVLCEKPFSLNLAEAKKVIAAARTKRIFLMEAFMYRCHPQIRRLKELLAAGTIGEIRMITGGFSYGGIDEDNTRMKGAEGGGGLMDVGCYPVSLARLIAGEEPVSCSGHAVFGRKSGVDHWMAATMKFPGGAIAHFDCGMMVNADWDVTAFGTKGKIRVARPWVPEPADARLEVTRYEDGKTETIEVPAKHIFANEAETVARCLDEGKTQAEEMSWDDTLGNMRALDALRNAIGLAWPQEQRVGGGRRRPRTRRRR